MNLDFPGITATFSPEVIILHSQHPLHVLSSAVVGGGLIDTQYIINRHVDKKYNEPDPVSDLHDFATKQGITEPFVGLMTAAYLDGVQTVTLQEDKLTVAAVVTAGLSNPAAAGLTPPVMLSPGTINIILLIDANLSPAAMVNAVITAIEAKTDVLRQQAVPTPEGHLATGTSTDSIVVACTGRENQLPYAGPATIVGWLIGRCVRQSLAAAFQPGDDALRRSPNRD
jgi:iron complex transport system ATP-binding protein